MSESPAGPAILFCPADRPDRYAKALDRADSVILDLEDAIAPGGKGRARADLVCGLARLPRTDDVWVRVNGAGTPWFDDDLAAVRAAGHSRVVLPKVNSSADLDRLDGMSAIAICETATGVLFAPEVARHDSCVALMWGGEDLMADLGGRRSRRDDGSLVTVVEHARSAVLLAAAAAGKVPLDSVRTDIDDLDGLRREAREAAELGFRAKACIHPNHIAVIRETFRPTEDEVARARSIVTAMARADGGVVTVDGHMVDAPLLRQAQVIVARRPPPIGTREKS